ncbi:MAG: peptide deformylase [Candidatus Kuenenia sp.]|nr:peptide deformylase [Candidatus Kuenenia sp.]
MNIVTYPATVLRQKAKPLSEINADVYKKAEKMVELMHHAHGIGLAAPQVGWSVRLFVIDVVGNDVVGNNVDDKVFINPSIMEEAGETSKEEGCLSFPGILGKVIRTRKIKVCAYNLNGQKIEVVLEDLLARAWQHELDHLNGCLFIDRMSPASRLAASQQLKELERSYKKDRVPV